MHQHLPKGDLFPLVLGTAASMRKNWALHSKWMEKCFWKMTQHHWDPAPLWSSNHSIETRVSPTTTTTPVHSSQMNQLKDRKTRMMTWHNDMWRWIGGWWWRWWCWGRGHVMASRHPVAPIGSDASNQWCLTEKSAVNNWCNSPENQFWFHSVQQGVICYVRLL